MTRCACITGASSGIGKALAFALAKEGIPLLLTGRNEAALKEVKLALSVPVTIIALDLRDKPSRRRLINTIKEMDCDLVINNAGLGYFGEALAYSTEEQLEVLEVNIEALTEITLDVARHLTRGTILNIASVAGTFVFPFHAVYSASKAFVKNLSLALDAEMRPSIRVLVSCPGLVESKFRERCTKGKNHSTTTDHYLPADKAAERIVRQIKKQQSIDIFPFSYRLYILLARLLPTRILYILFKKRYAHL